MKNVTTEKVMQFCFTIAFAILFATFTIQQEAIHEIRAQQEQKNTKAEQIATKGEFTLIQYTDAGWINPIYITEYSLDGQVLFYAEKGYKKLTPISLDNVRLVPGWIVGEELIKYGYWMPEKEF